MKTAQKMKFYVNPIQDGHFWGCSRVGGGGQKSSHLPKICHTHPTINDET